MPQPEWVAEESVDASRAADLIAAQFPELRGAAVQPFAEGFDNTVFVVAGKWAFRFPRRQVAIPGVEREIAMLPLLAPLLPLPVPVPELVGTPAVGYPWPFFGARLLPGRELADADLPDVDRTPAAAAAGRFLRVLHAPALAARFGSGLPVDPMRRASPTVRAPVARERLDRLTARGTWADDGSVEDLLSQGERLTQGPPASPVLVHGDLHVRHVLVDGDGDAVGVIDWGDIALADPCVDLALAFSAFAPGGAREAFMQSYGHGVGGDQELRARVLAVSLAAALADYADTDGRPALLAESLAGLRRAST
ncbi:MAG: phosphotransferase [Spirochaetaceae bacterium]|nr:phosphotransferase [Spirochaetaceae bacterium]